MVFYGNLLLKFIGVSIFFTVVLSKKYYKASFSDSVKACKDFKNDIFEINLSLTEMSEEGEGGGVTLQGNMTLNDDLGEGEVRMEIFKETEVGGEYVCCMICDLCDCVKQNGTAWEPMVKALKASECPIKKGVFPVLALQINLDWANDFLSHEYVGEYGCQMALYKGVDKIACFEVSVKIEEFDDEDDC